MLKQRIEQDLKKALLAGDKERVMTLRSLKSVVLYAEVAEGVRDTGLGDEAMVALFSKEAKKRQESADLYVRGGSGDRAAAELAEKAIIEEYLPKQLSDEELGQLIDTAITELGVSGSQAIGQVIGLVKQKTAGQADGGRIARIVKERLH
ncbi:MAG: GatB/YqeY domain-containing protein [Patescibacteria group bacterium]